MHDVGVEKGEITADVASRLIAEQFPQWSHLAVTPVELDGWDNTTFRLGDDLSVRLQARNRCRMSPPWLGDNRNVRRLRESNPVLGGQGLR